MRRKNVLWLKFIFISIFRFFFLAQPTLFSVVYFFYSFWEQDYINGNFTIFAHLILCYFLNQYFVTNTYKERYSGIIFGFEIFITFSPLCLFSPQNANFTHILCRFYWIIMTFGFNGFESSPDNCRAKKWPIKSQMAKNHDSLLKLT